MRRHLVGTPHCNRSSCSQKHEPPSILGGHSALAEYHNGIWPSAARTTISTSEMLHFPSPTVTNGTEHVPLPIRKAMLSAASTSAALTTPSPLISYFEITFNVTLEPVSATAEPLMSAPSSGKPVPN